MPPPLSAEAARIADDWMRYWHEVLPGKYGLVERFNHEYPLKHCPPGRLTTLELGAGIGAHLALEDLSKQDYYCVELRENMAAELRRRFPSVTVLTENCETLPYSDAFFDRIIAVHVLEHLNNLPRAVGEVRRVLKVGGIFSIVIPCDPGTAYEIARKISSERMFRKRYKLPYMWLMRREHLNSPQEVFSVMSGFEVIDREYFPFKLIPWSHANLCLGGTFRRIA